jgi:polyhydroxyalkanoate synthesis regulator phasin
MIERLGSRLERIPYSPVSEREQTNSIVQVTLMRSRKYLHQVPPEVVKTLAVTDQIDIPIDDKFRIAGYLFWETEGNFDLVKTYLGESEGPKLDSLLEQVWERNELTSSYRRVEADLELLDSILGTSPLGLKPQGILLIVEEIQEERGKGSSDADLLLKKRTILRRAKKRLEKAENDTAERELLGGTGYQVVAREHGINRSKLRSVRRRLFEEGRLDLGLTELELAIKKLRDGGVSNIEISDRLGIPRKRASRIIGKLLLMGLVDPWNKKGKIETEKARAFYDHLMDEIFSGKEVKGRHHIAMLRWLGEIDYAERGGWKHTPEAIEKIKKAKEVLWQDPDFRDAQLAMLRGPKSEETRKKISDTKKARMTDELRQRVSDSKKGKLHRGHLYSSEDGRRAALKRWAKNE